MLAGGAAAGFGTLAPSFASAGQLTAGWTPAALMPYPISLPAVERRLERWTSRFDAQVDELLESTHPNVREWRRRIAMLVPDDEVRMLRAINDLVNGIVTYVEDWQLMRVRDHWSTPLSTLTRGGDCEDIALTKAAAMFLRGWPRDRAHLVAGVAWSGVRQIFHMVLAAERKNGTLFVLDNLDRSLWSPRRVEFFKPIYSVSVNGTVLFTSREYAERLKETAAGNKPGKTAAKPAAVDKAKIKK